MLNLKVYITILNTFTKILLTNHMSIIKFVD